ncbi:MAG: hypothetical protein JXQ29_17210 [Planctomycetes bacterium]|nr:hypothetical protein [Planctomycetota bacterium]
MSCRLPCPVPVPLVLLVLLAASGCRLGVDPVESASDRDAIEALRRKGLRAEKIALDDFARGVAPRDFLARTGAAYRPSHNEDPAIPAQCWIETGYGTQNACLYCHTDSLAKIGHGNAYPLAEDQILYSFPTPALNHILWRNVIAPDEIDVRLAAEGVPLPALDDVAYVRTDNWTPAFRRARAGSGTGWRNTEHPDDPFALFPALDPADLFPYDAADPTAGGTHGHVDPQGFVRDRDGRLTGWRAVNFFPYGIFTPLTGSVSGVYIRLPRIFMTRGGVEDAAIYEANLKLLERQIKNRVVAERTYHGDASGVPVRKGFYPAGTEFAHPLHYVDRHADGEVGTELDGVVDPGAPTYEFPGLRAKRVKEVRYMYKWKEVTLAELAPPEDEPEFVLGREGQGWVDNAAGWILAGFIEDRQGVLRTQTTEELMQCMGCHGKVGNTIDSVWSFQRKLPGARGWGEMDYGRYDSRRPEATRLEDYVQPDGTAGELGHFFHSVSGADLYGVLPREIAADLERHALANDLARVLNLRHPLAEILDDERLSAMGRKDRESRLRERQAILRHYARSLSYLEHDRDEDAWYIKGAVFYPTDHTMQLNIQLYRKIVLDQSFHLGKDVFGTERTHVPFTFRSDGTVLDARREVIPVGAVITSRPYDRDGVGTTPTGIVAVNEDGVPVDRDGNPVDIGLNPERAVGHHSTGGTFETLYNPILGDRPVRKAGR